MVTRAMRILLLFLRLMRMTRPSKLSGMEPPENAHYGDHSSGLVATDATKSGRRVVKSMMMPVAGAATTARLVRLGRARLAGPPCESGPDRPSGARPAQSAARYCNGMARPASG